MRKESEQRVTGLLKATFASCERGCGAMGGLIVVVVVVIVAVAAASGSPKRLLTLRGTKPPEWPMAWDRMCPKKVEIVPATQAPIVPARATALFIVFVFSLPDLESGMKLEENENRVIACRIVPSFGVLTA